MEPRPQERKWLAVEAAASCLRVTPPWLPGVLPRPSASAAAPAAPNPLPVSQASRRASGQPGPGGCGIRTASRPAEARGAAARRSAAKPARAGRPAGPPSGPRARSPATPRRPRGRPRPAWRGERACKRLAKGLGCPGGLRPRRSVVAKAEKPGLGRGTDAPKVTPGVGQGGLGRGPVGAVRGRPRPGFYSPLTPPPLCARAAAQPSLACESARASWRSLLG